MCKFKMAVFKNIQPEELLGFFKNFNKDINGTVTTNIASRINYLRMMLCGEALQDFSDIASQNNRTTNENLKNIQQVLLSYLFLFCVLSKQKRAIRDAMRKTPHDSCEDVCRMTNEVEKLIPLFSFKKLNI